MKKFTQVLLCITALIPLNESLLAQEAEKPEYVIIADDQIITKEKLNEYGQQKIVKAIHKGVTQEVPDKLAAKFGANWRQGIYHQRRIGGRKRED